MSDIHPNITAWLQGANPDDLQSAEDWTLEPWPQVTLFELHCNCPACSYDGEEPDDEPADVDTDDLGDPAEGWLADSWAGAWDDDPSPYDGNYSEE